MRSVIAYKVKDYSDGTDSFIRRAADQSRFYRYASRQQRETRFSRARACANRASRPSRAYAGNAIEKKVTGIEGGGAYEEYRNDPPPRVAG